MDISRETLVNECRRAGPRRAWPSSRPLTTLHRTPAAIDVCVCDLRRTRKLGPARIGPVLGLPVSTVHRRLPRHGLNCLAWMDRPTGTVIRRYERESPGELIPIGVRILGRIPDGGGHKVHGREAGRGRSAQWPRCVARGFGPCTRRSSSLRGALLKVVNQPPLVVKAHVLTTESAGSGVMDLFRSLIPGLTPTRTMDRNHEPIVPCNEIQRFSGQ